MEVSTIGKNHTSVTSEGHSERRQLRLEYGRLLRSCSGLEGCKAIHSQMLHSPGLLEQDPFLGDLLAHTYLQCGCPALASQVLVDAGNSDVALWTRLISAFARNGHYGEAFQAFRRMQLQGVSPDRVTFLTVVEACAKNSALEQGRLAHRCIRELGLETDAVLNNAMVNMYGRCKSLEDAKSAFQKLQDHCLFSWTAIIAACSKQDASCGDAIQLYQQMQQEGVLPDAVTHSIALSACAKLEDLEQGRVVHSCIEESVGYSDVVLGNGLVHMYGSCRSPKDAEQVFQLMPMRNVISWNTMIAAYGEQQTEGVRLFLKMLLDGETKPDRITFLACLGACHQLNHGRLIHSLVVECGLERDPAVASGLLNMYSRCGGLEEVQAMFGSISNKDVFGWAIVIASHAEHGYKDQALHSFRLMQLEGVKPNKVVLMAALSACDGSNFLTNGDLIRRCAVEAGLNSDQAVSTSLLNMYSKCDSLEGAEKAFAAMEHQRDMVCWTTMISACSSSDNPERSIYFFRRMLLEGVAPDKVSLVTILSACQSVQDGELVNFCAVERGYNSDPGVCNAVVSMYSRCGKVATARALIDDEKLLPWRETSTWNGLMTAYGREEQASESIHLFRRMQLEGLKPDRVTMIALVGACSVLSDLVIGSWAAWLVRESGFGGDVTVANAVLNMYAKCGNVSEARNIFEGMLVRDTTSWNGMISAFSQHGHGEEAVQLFLEMLQSGVEPCEVTFLSLLHACSHAGLVAVACCYYSSMGTDFGVEAGAEHHACLVDLLGRSGNLEQVAKVMQDSSDPLLWTSLLGACKACGDEQKAKQAASRVMELLPNNSEAYVVLSASHGWDDGSF